MTAQLSLFQPKAIHAPVVADGAVVTDDDRIEKIPFYGSTVIDAHRRRISRPALEIQIARHDETGLWMWATSGFLGAEGWCYRVGAKWGQFAATREEAIALACKELRERVSKKNEWPMRAKAVAWLDVMEAHV